MGEQYKTEGSAENTIQSIVKMASDKVENVSFKVSLLENEKSLEKMEVRRFVVPQDCSTSLVYLKEKIRNIFNLGRSDCKVFWIDEDNDHVAIETDEELVIALQELNGPVYKLQVVKRNLVEINSDDNDNSAKNVSGEVHPGVVCDGCDGQVKGFRYKCMVCPDYDLCGTCEAKNIHPGHNMIRIASPETIYPRHFMNRLHRMSKRAGSCNGDYENTRPSFWNPRPQSCRPEWGRSETFESTRAEMAKKVREMKEAKSQAKEMKKEVKEMKKEMKKEEKKSANTKSADPWQIPEGGMPQIPPMTPMAPTPNLAKDIADLMQSRVLGTKQQEKKEDNKEEKPSDNLNEQINKMWASAEEPKESKKDEVREIKIQKENPISCHICQAPFPSENLFKSHMITVHETEDVSTNKDDDWTLLDKAATPEKEEQPSAPSAEPEEPAQGASGTLYPSLDEPESKKTQEEAKEPEAKKKPDYSNLNPKVRVAIEAMENMGFSNEDGWLTNLLEKYDGDIGKVLDLLQPVKPIEP